MPTLYVANFDFDDRLAKPAMTTLPKSLRSINARLAPLLESLCRPDDAVAVPGEWVADAGRFDRVEPWGVEPHVVGWLTLIGVRPEVLDRLPGAAAVRFLNGRRWQYEEELRLDVAPDDLALVEPKWEDQGDFTYLWFDKQYELGAGILRLGSGNCVVKAEFGASGRGVRIPTDESFDAIVAWGDRLLDSQHLLVERIDEADGEISAHLTVADDGVTFDGLCSLRSTPAGQFERVEPIAAPPAALLEPRPVWEAVAERARATGYRGYLGIDAAVKDGVVIRPIRDVNARWTMGRVALVTGRAVGNPL